VSSVLPVVAFAACDCQGQGLPQTTQGEPITEGTGGTVTHAGWWWSLTGGVGMGNHGNREIAALVAGCFFRGHQSGFGFGDAASRVSTD